MKIQQFDIREIGDVTEVRGVKDFDPDHIFDCGQCFRWERRDDGSYIGIAMYRVVRVEYDADQSLLCIHGTKPGDFENIWFDYFDLARDYGHIKRVLSGNDDVLATAIKYGGGIRILNQEKWETLLSFVISQNNNIPRIKKCIDSLAETLGVKVGEYEGRGYYSLPVPEVLASATVDELAPCRLGYRAKYLIETAKTVETEGMQSLEALADESVSREDAIAKLMTYCGVGPKVANCIALFSLKKFDSFPIDVWVKKVMHTLYGTDENDTKTMREYAAEHFGEYGGIAQQYLFHYMRNV